MSQLVPSAGRLRSRVLRLVPLAAAVALVALWMFLHPSSALAVHRPAWNPGPPWAPLDPKSHEMREISDLFWVMLALSAIIFAGVTGAIIYSAVRFRGAPGMPEPPQIYGQRVLEIVWTGIPFVILAIAFGFTVAKIHSINTPAKGETLLDVDAIGHQWWWQFYIPKYKVNTADEIHVPTGVAIHFHIESADVVHSFWVPQLQRQIDANPGQDNAVFVTMNTPGIFGGMCYEYCGDDHAWMKFRMVVQPPAQYAAWVHQQQQAAVAPTTALARAGQKVFLSNTCINCHTITGTAAGGVAGPDLTHVGSRWAIAGGAAPNTPGDIAAWINDPSTYKPGALMPPYPLLSKQDIKALAAYITSLK